MCVNLHLPIIKRIELARPNFLKGGLTRKRVRITGAQIPNTRENTFALALLSILEFLRLPELSLGCIAITIGWKLPIKPDRRASAIKMYSSPK
jgi:hypothetical protein